LDLCGKQRFGIGLVVFRIEQANRIGGGAIGQEYKVAIAAPDIEKTLIGYT
jgi:hypothetical protein